MLTQDSAQDAQLRHIRKYSSKCKAVVAVVQRKYLKCEKTVEADTKGEN